MAEPTLSDLMSAISRLDARLEAMNEKIDRHIDQTEDKFRHIDIQHDRMWKKIAELDAAHQVLKSNQIAPAPRAHWSIWVLLSIGILGFIATFVIYVVR
jgi:hypothetical protein